MALESPVDTPPVLPLETSPLHPQRSSSPYLQALTWSSVTVATLATLYTMYFARTVLVPVVVAAILAMVLLPLVDRLERARLPRSLAAGSVIIAGVALVSVGTYELGRPAMGVLRDAPRYARALEREFAGVRRFGRELEQAAHAIERATTLGKGRNNESSNDNARDQRLVDGILTHTQSAIASTLVVVVTLFFLLYRGPRLLDATLNRIPSEGRRARMHRMLRQIAAGTSRYLSVITVINAGLALVLSLVFALFGLPMPLVWGVLFGVLNFVPYVGPVCAVVVLSMSILVQPELGHAARWAPLVALAITGAEGQLITPAVVGRRTATDPLIVIGSLFFWGWLWGAAGVLVAVPLAVAARVAVDNYARKPPLIVPGTLERPDTAESSPSPSSIEHASR